MFQNLLNIFFTATPAWAQESAKKPDFIMSLVPFIAMFFIFYFLVLRPQVKKQKQHDETLKNLKKGDRILTTSGFLGTIDGITEKFITLEIAEKVKVRLLKAQVSAIINEREL